MWKFTTNPLLASTTSSLTVIAECLLKTWIAYTCINGGRASWKQSESCSNWASYALLSRCKHASRVAELPAKVTRTSSPSLQCKVHHPILWPRLRPQQHLLFQTVSLSTEALFLRRGTRNIVRHFRPPPWLVENFLWTAQFDWPNSCPHHAPDHEKWMSIYTKDVCATRFVAVVFWMFPTPRI